MADKKSVDELLNALQYGSKLYKAFKDGEELATAVKSLESSKKELEKALPLMRDEHDSVKEKLESDKKQLAKLNKELASKKEDVLAEANKEAIFIIQSAKEEAAKTIDKANSKLKAIQESIAMVETKHKEAKANLDALQAEIEKFERKKKEIINMLA